MNTNHYKEKLESEKKIIEDEMRGLATINPENGSWQATPEVQTTGPEADENDLADRSEDFEGRSSTVATLNTRLNDINDALGKIENQTYGTCEISGESIEEDRLEANPAARTCKAHLEDISR